MHQRTSELIKIMADNNLSAAKVAEMLNRKPTTILMWRTKSAYKVIPASMLELLKLKLRDAV